jgi:hypothetical protein
MVVIYISVILPGDRDVIAEHVGGIERVLLCTRCTHMLVL